jgi:hypothetical protein
MIPPAVLAALQEHIDRTSGDYLRQFEKAEDSEPLRDAFYAGKNLGMLQEWVFAQKRPEPANVPVTATQGDTTQ